MIVNRESRHYTGDARAWVGKYRNLTNLPHWHSDAEIVYAEQGNAVVTIDGENFALSRGNAVFIGSSLVHQIRADEGSLLAFFIFDNSLVEKIIGGKRLSSPLLSRDYDLPALHARMEEELEAGTRLDALSVNNRIERLVIEIFRGETSHLSEREENYMDARYKRLLRDIDENFSDYTVADAAQFLALSESYFSKFFRQMADMTFTQYLNLVRAEKAVEMIRKHDKTMTEIAISCGFGSIRNFNRVFKHITGYSPRDLPPTYSPLDMHPTYGVERTFDPTSADAILLTAQTK